jgi:AcrR family transcriptional regulator
VNEHSFTQPKAPMPALPAHIETTAPKTGEILRAVRIAFVEKGFDGASMQDLARAAGMSVGNFYRYFPSKDAIITQMIALDMAEIETAFAHVLQSPLPMQTLRELIAQRLAQNQAQKSGELWAEIAAAAKRRPDIAACACEMEQSVAYHFSKVFAAQTGLSAADCAQKFAQQSAFIIMLIRAAAMIGPQNSAQSPDLTPLIMRTINDVLDEISRTGSKG